VPPLCASPFVVSVARIKRDFGSKAAFRDGYLHGSSGGGHHLAVTRALGHRIMSESGVIPLPQLTSQALDASARALIIASDGVWDAFDSQTAVSVISAGGGGSAEEREREGEREWEREGEREGERERNVLRTTRCWQCICKGVV
jgi:hypothetical protein